MYWNSKVIVDYDDVSDVSGMESTFDTLRDVDVLNAIDNRLQGTGAIMSGRQLTASFEHYSQASSSSSTDAGAIAGIAIGVVAGVAILAVVAVVFVIPRMKSGFGSSAASILPDVTNDSDELELTQNQADKTVTTSTVVVI